MMIKVIKLYLVGTLMVLVMMLMLADTVDVHLDYLGLFFSCWALLGVVIFLSPSVIPAHLGVIPGSRAN
jgi:hypothetical protein